MTYLRCAAASVLALAGALDTSHAQPRVQYLYGLSDLSGPVRYTGGHLRVDAVKNETYFQDGNTIHVFNASGMEIYSFTVDGTLGLVFDVAIDESGDIFVGTSIQMEGQRTFTIHRCDYRGRVKSTIVPLVNEDFAEFIPVVMNLDGNGILTLISLSQLRAVLFTTNGELVRDIDLAPILMVDDEERGNLEIGDVAFDGSGNMLFTVPEHFQAIAVGSDWKRQTAFGSKGSGEGRFGIVSGIAADAAGNVYVADKARSVVLVFDRNRRFVSEFGGWGDRPENLVRPDQMAVSPAGRLYVAQKRNRGISVFELVTE